MLKPFPLQLGEANAAVTFDILNFNINNGGSVIVITILQVHDFGLVCFFPGCVYASTKQHARSHRL